MATSIVITNKNGAKLTFFDGEVNSSRYGIITKLFKAPLPDDNGENQIVINLGKELILSADFKLLNTPGQDAGVGSSPANPSTYETISTKLDYINNIFLTAGVTDTYTIDMTTHTGSILNKIGVIDNFNFSFSGSNPNSLSGTLSFSIGGGNVQ